MKANQLRTAIEIGSTQSYQYECSMCGFKTKRVKFNGRGSYAELAAKQNFEKHECIIKKATE